MNLAVQGFQATQHHSCNDLDKKNTDSQIKNNSPINLRKAVTAVRLGVLMYHGVGLAGCAAQGSLRSARQLMQTPEQINALPIHNRFIVEFGKHCNSPPTDCVSNIEQEMGVNITNMNPLFDRYATITVDGKRNAKQAQALCSQLDRSQALDTIETDTPLHLDAVDVVGITSDNIFAAMTNQSWPSPVMRENAELPNDPLAALQWDMYGATGGINLDIAHQYTLGEGARICTIDSGLSDGVNIISELRQAVDDNEKWDMISWPNDADGEPGYDRDPSMKECFWTSRAATFSHGEHVAGTIAAEINNFEGIAGVAPRAQLIPVKLINDCNAVGFDPIGGFTFKSDLVSAIRWVSQLSIRQNSKTITNSNPPVDVINLSFGTAGACGYSLQKSVDEAIANNVLLVTSAGNKGKDYKSQYPANCKGTLVATATDYDGKPTLYSNFGNHSVSVIAAPGGEIPDRNSTSIDGYFGNMILSTQGDDKYMVEIGTSMAAPHISGTIGLIRSLLPMATVDEVIEMLISNTKPFSEEYGSEVNLYGAGLLDSGAVVQKAASIKEAMTFIPTESPVIRKSQEPSEPSKEPSQVSSAPKYLEWSISGLVVGAACNYLTF